MTDKILTRIATRQSVSRASLLDILCLTALMHYQDQSAFMIDLQQMAMALNLATHRSLVIIDEFGKGTESYGGDGDTGNESEH